MHDVAWAGPLQHSSPRRPFTRAVASLRLLGTPRDLLTVTADAEESIGPAIGQDNLSLTSERGDAPALTDAQHRHSGHWEAHTSLTSQGREDSGAGMQA